VEAAATVVQQAVQPPVAPPPVAPPDLDLVPDAGAVTRFIARPAILDTPDQPATPAELVVPSDPYTPSESSTVILEPIAQRMASLRLVGSAGPAQSITYDVDEAGATLGRLPDNSICLNDGRLSRYHARIEFRDGGFWLSDLGSQNGTLVNDRPVTAAHRLQAGDSLQLGTSRLTVRLDSDD
jgi:pSer/pThr/pTyr-binding forkhead associated (FHA) protein